MSNNILEEERVKKYLDAIGIREPIKNRIETLYADVRVLFPREHISDIFISDYLQEDGTRKYQHLGFYTEEHQLISAYEFMSNDDIRVGSFRNNVYYIIVRKTNYDLVNATEDSRLHIKAVTTFAEMAFEAKASKKNCDYLRDIVSKYLVPNLKK